MVSIAELPASNTAPGNVTPRSSVVAASDDGRTEIPWATLSTYLLFVASVGLTGSGKRSLSKYG